MWNIAPKEHEGILCARIVCLDQLSAYDCSSGFYLSLRPSPVSASLSSCLSKTLSACLCKRCPGVKAAAVTETMTRSSPSHLCSASIMMPISAIAWNLLLSLLFVFSQCFKCYAFFSPALLLTRYRPCARERSHLALMFTSSFRSISDVS